MPKIAIFYHVGQLGNWHEIYTEQINRLQESGLLQKSSYFHISINGDEPLPFIPDNVKKIAYNEDKVLEANTLEYMWHFAQNNPDYKILYLHTKGVTRYGIELLQEQTKAWRYYMEYFCVDNWEACCNTLDAFDTCGVQIEHKATYNTLDDPIEIDATYYNGNFWWAKASYIKQLDPKFLYTSDTPWLRGKSELWIGSGNPNAANLFTLEGENPYFIDYSPSRYMHAFKQI
jgi:hypothetical protein